MRGDDGLSGRREPGFSRPRVRADHDWAWEEERFEDDPRGGYARPPAPRLRLGAYLPALLTGAINLTIPAVLFSTQMAHDRVRSAEQAYLARVAETGPPCALDLSNDNCLCSDFSTQAEAIAYVQALRQPPKARFGLYTDGSDLPCGHLPPR